MVPMTSVGLAGGGVVPSPADARPQSQPHDQGAGGGVVPSPADAVAQGVGPWPGGPQQWPRDDNGDVDPRFDVELLTHGDQRNVIDRYRYWTMDAIVADLDEHRHPLHIAIENWHHDFNIGSVVRTANAFAVAEVHIVGKRRWNRRGAMVTDRYQHIRHHEDAQAFAQWAQDNGLTVIGIDNIDGSVPIEGFAFPRASVLVFGQESTGLTQPMQEVSQSVVHITQYGSTRSMNAGAAAAIAMHAWIVQHIPTPGQ